MRRFLVPLFVVIFILAMLAVLIARGGATVTLIQNGQGVVSFIISLVQLVGIALLLGLAIFVIIEYARYIRSNRFIFEGFSNASKLIETGHMPFDLGILAREELIFQFRNLNSEWRDISGSAKADDDIDALLTDGLYLGKSREKLDLSKHVPADVIENLQVLEELQAVITSIKDSEGINLMALAEEIVPKEVTPVMKFVEAIAPPHIIRATGYLQWRRDDQDGTGISFEFVDLGNQQDLMVRTIWWRAKETEAEANKARNAAQASFVVNLDDGEVKPRLAKNEQVHGSDEDEFSLAAKRYIELLEPAMRWLALMFWKQNMISNIPRREKRSASKAGIGCSFNG